MIRKPKRHRLYGGRQKEHGKSFLWTPSWVRERAKVTQGAALFRWIYSGSCGPFGEPHSPCACHPGPLFNLIPDPHPAWMVFRYKKVPIQGAHLVGAIRLKWDEK